MGKSNSLTTLFLQAPTQSGPSSASTSSVVCTDYHILPNGALGARTRHHRHPGHMESESLFVGSSDLCNREFKSPRITTVEDIEEMSRVEACADDEVEDRHPASETEKRTPYAPVSHWLSIREEFLFEMIRQEGRCGQSSGACALCPSEEALYRCTQCIGSELVCRSCIVALHRRNPLHIIETWTKDAFFHRGTLKGLGLQVQLGHLPEETCKNPQRAHQDGFIVIDTYGIQEVDVYFCGCETAPLRHIQILRNGWYPASTERPKTAATISVLKYFQLLNFESKVSQFEFYNTLVRWSDNTGIISLKDRYPAFLAMVREYRNLKQLKRGGRGHKEGGIAGTEKGELAVLCPMCPQPGINMADDWKDSKPEERYLHAQFLAIDANFRLKRRNISNEERDPDLGDGWSYWPPQSAYRAHVAEYDTKVSQPKSTCSDHKAVNAERAARGFAATGVVTVDCAHHEMKRPLSVGDLFKGERFVNTDYMFFGSLRKANLHDLDLVVSYDISCQWSTKIHQRMLQYPEHMHLKHLAETKDDNDRKPSIRFLVPKFHLPAHVTSCQTKYSFNLSPYVGRTDGESVERGWSRINPIAPSSMEMGPGTRRDTLNDHFSDSNWKKTTSAADLLRRKIKEAVQEASDYRFLHNQFTLGLPEDNVSLWGQQLAEWEKDSSKPNPFEKKYASITQESVRQRLAKEDREKRKDGTAYIKHEEISAAQLISIGMDLEEQQRHIAAQVSKKSTTTIQKATYQNRINVLERKVSAWMSIQLLYMPDVHLLRQQEAKATSAAPEPLMYATNLLLPSATLKKKDEKGFQCDERLLRIEHDLRHAQASDALDELRNSLRLRSYVYRDKDQFQRGQRRNTRSRDIISRLDGKVSTAVSKYQAAREAILLLAPKLGHSNAEDDFPALNKSDIRGFNDNNLPKHMQSKSQKKKERVPSRKAAKEQRKNAQKLSWIWKRTGAYSVEEGDDVLQEDLRIEFCKSKARASRWKEEVLLLQEEMHRTKRFFRRRAQTWTKLASPECASAASADAATQDGLRAFALQQANLFESMLQHCEKVWSDVPTYAVNGHGRIVELALVGPEDI